MNIFNDKSALIVGANLKKEEKTEWKNIKKRWLEQNSDELRRISQVDHCFFDLVNKLPYHEGDNIPQDWFRLHPTNFYTDEHKVMILHALEIQKMYKDHYFTFIHGQARQYWIFHQFVKELAKLVKPELDHSLFHYLRVEGIATPIQLQALFDSKEVDDGVLRRELLSVDGYFFCTKELESTNYCIAHDWSALGKSSIDHQKNNFNDRTIQQAVQHYFHKKSSIAIPSLQQLMKNYLQDSRVPSLGTLFTISIPKNLVENFALSPVYASHDFGKICRCEEEKQGKAVDHYTLHKAHVEMLRCFQRNPQRSAISYENSCLYQYRNTMDVAYVNSNYSRNIRAEIPQFRIITSSLNAQEMRIIRLMAVSQAVKKEYKEKIVKLAKGIYDECCFDKCEIGLM